MPRFPRLSYYTLFCLLFAVPTLAQRLPTGQMLHPSGTQGTLSGTFPMAVIPLSGKRLLVTCGGALQGLSFWDTRRAKETTFLPFQTIKDDPQLGRVYFPTGSAFYGLAASSDGHTIYSAQGSGDKIGIYKVTGDRLTPAGTLDEPTGDTTKPNFPAGLCLSPDGTQLYVANNLSDTLAVFDLASREKRRTVPVGGYPLAVCAGPGKVYVTSERDGFISVVNTATFTRLRDIATGSHPNALLLSYDRTRLYVANAGSDTLSLVDTRSDTVLRTLLLRPSALRGLPCATPTSIAQSPDGRALYITLADLNAVAVVRLNSTLTDGSLAGLIPAGWYPSAVAVLPGGKTLCIINAKGSHASHPNSAGPGPVKDGIPARYIHDIVSGSVSLAALPNAATLAHDTRQVLTDNDITHPLDPDAPAAASLLSGLPIKHVFYIIKENRTYDQVLGDNPRGMGDPSLTLFGQRITPNQHALAGRFVLLDNFYACAEVSSDGWNWSTSGFANNYVQRTVPDSYSERKNSPRPTVRPYDYEGENRGKSPSLAGQTDVAESPGGYIWDAIVRAHLSLRNYGCFLAYKGDLPTKPALVKTTCPDFAPFSMKYADSDAWVLLGLAPPGQGIPKPGELLTTPVYGTHYTPSRFTAWKQEFDGYVKTNTLPAFEIIRLPRDHTQATDPGFDSPLAMAADNDYSVGEIADAVSHSPYWASSAIFVVEDDAQNGPDHIDCHRTTAFVLSPFIKPHSVDHHFYNTDSLLRTMELLLHLAPMTHYDASAPPLRAFTRTLDPAPFNAILPDPAILAQTNPPDAYKAALSHSLNFTEADAAPDALISDILWHTIKGANIPLPPTRHAQ